MAKTGMHEWLIRWPIVLLMAVLPLFGAAQDIQLKNNSFYIDGRKFFVKGIGYEIGATPGMVPWARTFNAELLRSDIRRILGGGYNTIRTWAPFTAQELDILKQYDIKIIMGIWIDPAGKFADPAFVAAARAIVSEVLAYSPKYNNIIAYLIMNEPQPEIIAREGYDQSVALWKELAGMIHAAHPNRPVSIANTCNGTYIDPEAFDFSAYNVYIYNPVTVNYLHGYSDYIRYLRRLNPGPAPLVVTEYGLSVSPTGPGNWGYGGNSLAGQQEGILHMYKSLVDGGATGSCVFNYSDGWWKAGNEWVHDDAAEEWFGLVGYSSLSDQTGQERPVWQAVKAYQSAIITEPRSSEIYTPKVPVEVFSADTIDRIEILAGNKMVYHRQPVPQYLSDTVVFQVADMEDATLVFNCYDAKNNLVKSEEKNILIASRKLTLPSVGITIGNADYWKSGYIDVNYRISRPAMFAAGTRLDYVFYPHVGFNYGDKFQTSLAAGELVTFSCRHYFDASVSVMTVGAAFDVTYNSFRRRIVNQVTLSRINRVPSSADALRLSGPSVSVYPNPVRDAFTVSFDGTTDIPFFDVSIIDSRGSVVMEKKRVGPGQPVDIRGLAPGIYYIRVLASGRSGWTTHKLIKL